MYNNVGGKLKLLATIIFLVILIGAFIGGILAAVPLGGAGFFIFLLVAGGGALMAYLSGIFIYAFGELVENSSTIKKNLSSVKRNNDEQKDQKSTQSNSIGVDPDNFPKF